MAEAAFNTIAEIQRLRDAGIEQKQAEAITLSIHAGVTGGVATKADLELVRADVDLVRTELDGKIDLARKDVELVRKDVLSGDKALKAEIDGVEQRLDAKIDLLRTEMKTDLKWIMLIGGAILAVLILPWLEKLVSATMP